VSGMSTSPRSWVVALAAVIMLVLVSLTAVMGYQLVTKEMEPMASTEAVKSGTGDLRTDLDPLLTRFPVLAGMTGARWMSGTYGRGEVPGPSTYWIDAVVTLPAGRVEQLVAAHSPTAQGKIPEVSEGLRAQLPAGPFLTGDVLNRVFTHERWSASVYLDPTTNQVVLTATGT
jgi:hypothetical protein